MWKACGLYVTINEALKTKQVVGASRMSGQLTIEVQSFLKVLLLGSPHLQSLHSCCDTVVVGKFLGGCLKFLDNSGRQTHNLFRTSVP